MERSQHRPNRGDGASKWGHVIQFVQDRVSQKDRELTRTKIGGEFFHDFHTLKSTQGRTSFDGSTENLLRALPTQKESPVLLEEGFGRQQEDVDEIYLSLLQSVVNSTETVDDKHTLIAHAKGIFAVSDAFHTTCEKVAGTAIRRSELSHIVKFGDVSANFDEFKLPSIKGDVFVAFAIVEAKQRGKKGSSHTLLRADVDMHTRRFVFGKHLFWGEVFSCSVPDPKLTQTSLQVELWKYDPFMEQQKLQLSPKFSSLSSSYANLFSPSQLPNTTKPAEEKNGTATTTTNDSSRGMESDPFASTDEEYGDIEDPYQRRGTSSDGEHSDDDDDDDDDNDDGLSVITEENGGDEGVDDGEGGKKQKKKPKEKKKKRRFKLKVVKRAVGKTLRKMRISAISSAEQVKKAKNVLNLSTSSDAGEQQHLVARGYLPLAEIGRSTEEHTIKMYKGGANTDIKVRLFSNLELGNRSVSFQADRKMHRLLLKTIFFNSAAEYKRKFGGKVQTAWDCLLDAETHDLIRLHAEWMGINSTLQRLDFLSTLISLHGNFPVSMVAIHTAIQGLSPQESWDESDHQMYLFCLQAIYSYCFPKATSPFKNAAEKHKVDVSELRAQIGCLIHIFDSDIWQTSLGSTHQLPGNFDESVPVVQFVKEYIDRHEFVTYLAIEKKCKIAFGEDTFERYRGKIQTMLHEKLMLEEEMSRIENSECCVKDNACDKLESADEHALRTQGSTGINDPRSHPNADVDANIDAGNDEQAEVSSMQREFSSSVMSPLPGGTFSSFADTPSTASSPSRPTTTTTTTITTALTADALRTHTPAHQASSVPKTATTTTAQSSPRADGSVPWLPTKLNKNVTKFINKIHPSNVAKSGNIGNDDAVSSFSMTSDDRFARNDEFFRLSVSLPKILRSLPCTHLTQANINNRLMEHFDKKIVLNSRRLISKHLLSEIRKRRAHPSKDVQIISLTAELQREVEQQSLQRYFAVKFMASMLEKTQEGSDIDRLVQLMKLLTQDIALCADIAKAYSELPGFDVVGAVSRVYEERIAEDVHLILERRKHDLELPSAQTPVALFELYFTTQTFWDTIVDVLETDVTESFALKNFCTWFQPFVVAWLQESTSNAELMIERALKIDTFELMDSGTDVLFSESVYHCYNILFDILDFWDKINWPDAKVAEEVLSVHLANAVCGVIRFYTDALLRHIFAKHEETVAGQSPLAYAVPSFLFSALNNLTFAMTKLEELRVVMRIEELQKVHQEKAIRANQGHGGKIVVHKSVKKFEETQQALLDAISQISILASSCLCVRVQNDLVAIAHGYPRQEDKQAYIIKKLTGLLGFDHSLETGVGTGDDDCDGDRCLSTRRERMSRRTKNALSNINTSVMKHNKAYLFDALATIMCNLQDERAVDAILSSIWREIMVLLRKIFLQQVQTGVEDTDMLSRLVFDFRANFKHFFAGDGKGLSPDIMKRISSTEFDPVLSMARLNTFSLVSGFFSTCAQMQTCALEAFVKGGEILPDLYKPLKCIGELRVSIQYAKESDTLTIRVVQAQAIERVARVYLLTRQLSVFGDEELKTVTPVCGSGPVVKFDHTLQIPSLKSCRDAAIQLRVQHRSTITRRNIVLGEVLLSPRSLHTLRSYLLDRVTMTLPLFPLAYHGQPGWYQQHINTHKDVKKDPILKLFVAKYQKRFTSVARDVLATSLSSSTSSV